MSDAEVALELLKLLLANCPEAKTAALKKDGILQQYRECLAVVRAQDKA